MNTYLIAIYRASDKTWRVHSQPTQTDDVARFFVYNACLLIKVPPNTRVREGYTVNPRALIGV